MMKLSKKDLPIVTVSAVLPLRRDACKTHLCHHLIEMFPDKLEANVQS